jgi:hypothetical protein
MVLAFIKVPIYGLVYLVHPINQSFTQHSVHRIEGTPKRQMGGAPRVGSSHHAKQLQLRGTVITKVDLGVSHAPTQRRVGHQSPKQLAFQACPFCATIQPIKIIGPWRG